MAESGWRPLATSGGRSPPGDEGPRRLERGLGRRERVVAAVAAAVAAAGWIMVGPDGGAGDKGPPDEAMSEIRERTADDATSTTLEEHNANRAFAQASLRLEDAGSFSYHGHVETDDPPAGVPSSRSVQGEVSLAKGSRQISSNGPSEPVTETLVVGLTIWERRVPSEDRLAEAPFSLVGDVDPDRRADDLVDGGIILLPRWLGLTTDRRYLGTDSGTGQRLFRARIPAGLLAPNLPADPNADAEEVTVDLRVDAEGDPVGVTIGTDPRALDLAITDLGGRVAIDPPPGQHPT